MSRRESLDHPKQIFDSLKILRNENKLCDVTIMIGQEELKAHRLVLMAASDYFKAMFSNETKEAKTGIVEFVETPPEIVKQCIEFIYTGNCEFSMENAKDFLNASEMMQLGALSDLYVKFLSERVNAENCIGLISLAETYEKDHLRKCVQDFLLKYFHDFSKSDSFLSLDQDLLKHCFTLLEACGEELEILKWKGILAWVKCDIENRKAVFPDLFKLVDLSYLSKRFIKEDILREPLIRETNECLCIVTDSAFRDLDTPKASLIPRKAMSHMLACSNVTKLIHQYDLESKEWSQVTNLPECGTDCIDIITHRGSIYVGNGIRLYRYSTWWLTVYDGSYETYDRRGRRVTKRLTDPCYNRCIGSGNAVHMITSRARYTYTLSSRSLTRGYAGCQLGDGFSIAASDKTVYALGGNGSELKSVELMSSHPMSRMNCPRTDGIALWFNNMIYALGGGSSYPECYNPITDQWQVISGITISCSGAKAYIGDKLYIFGGSQSDNILTVDLEKLKIPEDKVIQTPNVDMKQCCAAYL